MATTMDMQVLRSAEGDTTAAQQVDAKRQVLASKAAVALVDTLTMTVASLLALLTASAVLDGFAIEWHRHLLFIGAAVPAWPVVFATRRLYIARFFLRVADEVKRLLSGVVYGTVLMALAAFATRTDLSRLFLVLTAAYGMASMVASRSIVRAVFQARRRAGRNLRPVAIVGLNLEGLELFRTLQEHTELGYDVVGFIDDDPSVAIPDIHVLGPVADTVDVVRRSGAQGVIIAATAIDLEASNRLIRELTDAGIHVQLSSTLRDIASYRLTVQPLGRFPVVYVEPVIRTGWRQIAKRTFDVTVAGLGLVAALPVLVVAAAAIKLDSRGPVLFRQNRVGRNGELFPVLKLRTMVTDAEQLLADLRESNQADGPLFKMAHDPRVTRVGRLLRKTSLDELPQLWNVLRNEMSLVGPRPALPAEVEQWEPELHQRLRVKPGITGMWQVHGRSNASFAEYSRLDLYYVDNWSIVNDLAIVARTVPTVLLRKGAY